jgi:hypothetical protein
MNYYIDNQLKNSYIDNQLEYYKTALELKSYLKKEFNYKWNVLHNRQSFTNKYFENSRNTPNRQCMIFFNLILGRGPYDRSPIILNLETDFTIRIMIKGKNFMLTNMYFNYKKLEIVFESLEKGKLKYGDKLCICHLFDDCSFGEKCEHCNYVKNNYNIVGLLNMNCGNDKKCRDLSCDKYHQNIPLIRILCDPERCVDKDIKEGEEKKCPYGHFYNKIKEMKEEEKEKELEEKINYYGYY